MKTEVSELLMRRSAGDKSALESLTPLVYEELRRLGRSGLRWGGGADSIVQSTVLVREASLRFAGNQRFSITTRAEFYALASKKMRDILVDAHRSRRAAKRGGRIAVALDDASPAEQPHFIDFLILDDALRRLGQLGERYQRIVELRFFAGLTVEETAAAVGVSHATVEREWNFARAWLRREVSAHSARHRGGSLPRLTESAQRPARGAARS